MTILNIAGSLFAISIVTWLLYFVTELTNRPDQSRFRDTWATVLALLFVVLYVAIAGWLGNSVVPAFHNALWGIAVTAVLYVVAVAVTVLTLRKRHKRGSETELQGAPLPSM